MGLKSDLEKWFNLDLIDNIYKKSKVIESVLKDTDESVKKIRRIYDTVMDIPKRLSGILSEISEIGNFVLDVKEIIFNPMKSIDFVKNTVFEHLEKIVQERGLLPS